jgi:hypothetical protein
LTLCVQGIKGKGGLTGATETGYHNEPVSGYGNVQLFQVVDCGAFDHDEPPGIERLDIERFIGHGMTLQGAAKIGIRD